MTSAGARKRLAIFAVGGIGVGFVGQGLPTMGLIVERLAAEYDVTYYSLVPTNPGFTAAAFRVSAPAAARDAIKGAKWLALVRRFLADHARAPFDALMSFWAYPMGTAVVALARALRRPSIVLVLGAELASLPAIDYGHLRHPVSRRLVRATCAAASRLVLISEQQRGLLRAAGIDRPDARAIPWGVDTRLFSFAARDANHTELRLVHAANLAPVKDQATLLRAFAVISRRRPARLRVLGQDYLNGGLQALARELGVEPEVEFVGMVPHAEVVTHYRWADAFVLTSLSEGQNGALTEAIACGLLPISTGTGLAADLGPEVAVIVRTGDPGDLAEKILAIDADRAGWARRVARARAWSEAHDLGWTVRALAALVDEVT